MLSGLCFAVALSFAFCGFDRDTREVVEVAIQEVV